MIRFCDVDDGKKFDELDFFRERIEGLVDLNMMEDATEECLRMADRHPDNGEFLCWCTGIVSYGRKEQVVRMRGFLDRYLEKQPSDWAVRQVWVIMLGLEGRNQECLAEFAKIPDETLRHCVRWFWFKVLLQHGPREEVRQWVQTRWREYLDRVMAEDKITFLRFLWDVSAFRASEGEYETAANGYRVVLDWDPGAQGAYLGYGRVLLKLRRQEEAIEIFKKGLRLSSKEMDNQCVYQGVINYGADERHLIWLELRKELAGLGCTDGRKIAVQQ